MNIETPNRWFRGNLIVPIWLLCCSIFIAFSIRLLLLRAVYHSPDNSGGSLQFGILFWAGLAVLGWLCSLPFSRFVLTASWFGFGIALLLTWIVNAQPISLSKVLTIFCILLVYFVLEGYELAVTDLLDKDVSQFLDQHIAAVIEDVRVHKEHFYNAREWIIVLLAVVMTMRSDFDHLRLPLLGALDGHPRANIIFSTLFTTFTIVWIAQVPPKHLATLNSIEFLTRFKFLYFWPFIRYCGKSMEKLHLHAPSRLIVRVLSLHRSGAPRYLRPSDSAYFIYNLRAYGYGYHSMKNHIVISEGGRCRMRERGLFYVVSSEPREFVKLFTFDSAAKCTHKRTWAYYVPGLGETLREDLREGLDRVFDEDPAALPKDKYLACTDIIFFDEEDVREMHKEGRVEKNYTYVIRTAASEKIGMDQGQFSALAIGFEIEFECEPGCFRLPEIAGYKNRVQDAWTLRIGYPWRSYQLDIELDDESLGSLIDAKDLEQVMVSNCRNRLEEDKILSSTPSNTKLRRSFKFPLVGTVYKLGWEVGKVS